VYAKARAAAPSVIFIDEGKALNDVIVFSSCYLLWDYVTLAQRKQYLLDETSAGGLVNS
jgi:hypothetical protein